MQIRTAKLIVYVVDGRRFVALNVRNLLGIALYRTRRSLPTSRSYALSGTGSWQR